MRNQSRRGLVLAAAIAVVLAGCSDDDAAEPTSAPTPPTDVSSTDPPATEVPATAAPSTAVPTTEPPAEPLQILVTNDDGVGAPGIDALVQGLLTLEDVEVTVVAPATQQSGTGGSTTDGPLTVTDATTAGGYPAKAIAGFPADTIIWAIDQGGLGFTPDLVIAGINEGQNLGPVIDLSGTVGAARAAANRGILALATSQGLAPEGEEPRYDDGVAAVLAWLTENVQTVADHEPGDPVTEVVSINIPTCVGETDPRGTLEVPLLITPAPDQNFLGVADCASTLPAPVDDVTGFLHGFVVVSPTPLQPATTG
jgi:5'-nucleotidase